MSKTKVVSIRISPHTLADVYNFLQIACDYNVSNLAVSKAVNISLDNMMRWVRQSIDLPNYATDEEAVQAIENFINRRPAAYIEKSSIPSIQDTPSAERPARQFKGDQLSDAAEEASQHIANPVPEDLEARERKEQRAKGLISLIDNFMDKEDEKRRQDLLDAVTIGGKE